MINDTIASIATALNESGIGIIRISGKNALSVADKLYVNKDNKHVLLSYKSHTIHYGYIVFEEEIIDEVMISVMKAPNTFTREDVVEINCHGGVLICKKVLNAVLSSGARLSEPGEFTKRAFLNGRIDLSKAEAVMDLISSKNELSVKNSLKHLNGKLYDKIIALRKRIIHEIAFIESAIDDPEHFSLDEYPVTLKDICMDIKKEIKLLHDSFLRGKFIKDGINTVIVGKPNVGKSSLLNLLCCEEKAIVTDIAGTTRDIIETNIVLDNISLNLIDTAGIRQTDDIVENIGVERARKYALDADLILFLIDVSRDLDEEDKEIVSLISDKNVIVLLNKSDLGIVSSKEKLDSLVSGFKNVISFSSLTGEGRTELEKCINDMFFEGKINSDDEIIITATRQAEELNNVLNSIDLVMQSIENGLPEDFFSVDLMNAYQSLGRIIGEEVDDDLVEEIFSKFCMGK